MKVAHQFQSALESALQQYLATVQPSLRRQALQEASAYLIHPGMILAAPQLTATHPLRQEALAVSDALEAVTNGMQTREVMEALDTIEPESVFQPWRHLVLGLHFFYDELDEAAAAHFLAIPKASPLASLAKTMGSFLDLQGCSPLESAAASLLSAKIHHTDSELSALVQNLTDSLESAAEGEFWNTLADFLEACREGDLGARCVLWVWGQLEWLEFDEQQLLDLTIALWGKPEAYRLAALGSASWDPEASALLWLKFLIQGLREELLSEAQLIEAHALANEFYQAAEATETEPGGAWRTGWNALARSWESECRLRGHSFPLAHDRQPNAGSSPVPERGQLDLFSL